MLPNENGVSIAEKITALTQCEAITEALKLEHKEIEKALQSLVDASVTAPSDTLAQLGIIDTVLDFFAEHFQSEERVFSDQGYARLEEHTASHERLLREFHDARRAISEGQLEPPLDVSTLIGAFHAHVALFDRPAYVSLLWRHFDSGSETGQHISELASLDRLGKITWRSND